MRSKSLFRAAWLAPAAALMFTACFESPNDPGKNGDVDTLTVPSTYSFLGPDGASNVDYAGQTVRNLLIADIQAAARVPAASGHSGPFTANDILKYYQHVDTDSIDILTNVTGSVTRLHAKYARIASQKSLHNKISPAVVIGYGVPADSLIRRWAAQIAANSLDSAKRRTKAVYLDTNGADLSQLLSKVMGGAVAYYQATTEYLQPITQRNNTDLVTGTNYTQMEHNWDEAFGYFGAARDYVTNYTDQELTTGGASSYKDANGDGKIDFGSEYNFSMMGRYVGRRDLGISGQDWTGDAFKAFAKGRALISAKGSADSIAAQRAIIVDVWEKTFAANTISYIKTVKTILDTTVSYDLDRQATLGGFWGEMKAFSVCLQFSPYKKASDAQLAQLQTYLGTGPVRGAGKDAYMAQLDQALALVKSIYGFSDTQVNSDTWR
jgi:hypothetical protein